MSMTSLTREQIAQKLYRYDKIHLPLASPDLIDDRTLATYRQTGLLAVENVFTRDDAIRASAALTHLINHGFEESNGVQYEPGFDAASASSAERERHVRKVWHFCEHEPFLKSMSQDPRLVSIVERLVGSQVEMIQDMALLKPPNVGTEKPWHQDNAYFLREPMDLVIGTWIAVDEATPANGCMHMIPGSHLAGPKPHFHDRDCQLPDEDVETERDVVVPLKPGGVLFFSALVHHGTPPNTSSLRRRALQYHYASVNCRPMPFDRHKEIFTPDAGSYTGCAGWAGKVETRKIAERGL